MSAKLNVLDTITTIKLTVIAGILNDTISEYEDSDYLDSDTARELIELNYDVLDLWVKINRKYKKE